MLLEGEDLTVVNGKVMVRTVSGLKPISVLWRRLDSAYADPLELNQNSHIGTPGLVEAMRAGRRHDRQCARFRRHRDARAARLHADDLPRLVRRGPEAAVDRHLVVRPAERTRPCGRPISRSMVIGPAYSRAALLRRQRRIRARLGAEPPPANDRRMAGDRSAPSFVGQEAVTLSTTPTMS
jgi:uncharacterized circularly permuted ATP-grasp superfamily protein